jgi:hypothetical protein
MTLRLTQILLQVGGGVWIGLGWLRIETGGEQL